VKKLNVLIGCLNFNGYTGSGIIMCLNYKQLLKKTAMLVFVLILLPLAASAKKLGINLFNLQEPPV
jgi:hypothetical protein